ncbi:hypothetical protein IKJ53_03280, partial [bacterium]|nr:hypothetical protein [bacterium]
TVGNRLYNTGLTLTLGKNIFENVITNDAKNALAPNADALVGVIPVGLTIYDEGVNFITTGENTFNATIYNNGIIQFSGTNDTHYDVLGKGAIYYAGTAKMYGEFDDNLKVNISKGGKLIMSAYEQEVATFADGEEDAPQIVMIPSYLSFDILNGGDTWDVEGTLSLDGGIVDFVGATFADDATVDDEKALNGSFTSSNNGGILNILGGAFVLKNASTSTSERTDLQDSVKVTLNTGSRMIIIGREVVNLGAEDTIHEGASFKLHENVKLTLNQVVYIDENNNILPDLNLVHDNFILGESTTAKFINDGININISSDQSNYKGIYEQNSEVITNVLRGGKVFGGAKYINNGELNIHVDLVEYTEVYLGNNAIFTNTLYDATTPSVITTNGVGVDDKGVLNFVGEGATAVFQNGVPTARYVKYDLANNIQNDKSNTIKFINSEVILSATGVAVGNQAVHNYVGATKYEFSDSYINLTNNQISDFENGVLKADAPAPANPNTCDIYQFTTLVTDKNNSNRTYVALNIDFTERTSDVFQLKSLNSSGYLYIDAIDIMTQPPQDDGQTDYVSLRIIQYDNALLKNYDAQQLKEGTVEGLDLLELVLVNETAYNWTSSIKNTYLDANGNVVVNYNNFVGVKSLQVASVVTKNDSLVFDYEKRDDLLREVNRYNELADPLTNTKTFNFTGAGQRYSLTDNSGESARGIFNIVGDNTGSIIDAVNKYSLFNMKNMTEMSVSNITFTNAVQIISEDSYGIPMVDADGNPLNGALLDASVFYINNPDVKLTLSGVTFRNNVGNAIYNNGSTSVSFENVSFEEPDMDGLTSEDNALYNNMGEIFITSTNQYINNFATNITNARDAIITFSGENKISGIVNNYGVFTIGGITTVENTINQYSGTFILKDNVTVDANVNIANKATLTIESDNDLSQIIFTKDISNLGTLLVNGNAVLRANILSDINVDSIINVSGTGILTVGNNGIIDKSHKLNFAIDSTVNVDEGTLEINSDDVLSGKIVLGTTLNGLQKDISVINYYGVRNLNETDRTYEFNSGTFNLLDGVWKVIAGDVFNRERYTLSINLTAGEMQLVDYGTDAFTLGEHDTWTDTVVSLSNSHFAVSHGINEDSTLLFAKDNQLTNFDAADGETSSFSILGANLTISANLSKFKGLYVQDKIELADGSIEHPSMVVTETGTVFGGAKDIKSGTVDITSNVDISFSKFNLVGNNDDKVSFKATTTGGRVDETVVKFTGEYAKAVFTNYVAPVNAIDDTEVEPLPANYIIGQFTADNAGNFNTLVFENSNIVLDVTDNSIVYE